ncbi:MAG: glyoxalase/bleomycin resistance protein/dioxygenase [Pedosphaera sp.]|nr:glyoxalase/bleomycin resistance protein/dioxygenase [Pedosphaera sp.]
MNTTKLQLNTYLSFNGQCEAAFKFYEQTLRGKIENMMTFESMPAEFPVPDAWRKKILHVTLRVGSQELMGSDAPPERYQKPAGCFVNIGLTDPAEAERIFNALAENGTVTMPLQKTFWAVRFGMLVDRFDIPWMINCGQPA